MIMEGNLYVPITQAKRDRLAFAVSTSVCLELQVAPPFPCMRSKLYYKQQVTDNLTHIREDQADGGKSRLTFGFSYR